MNASNGNSDRKRRNGSLLLFAIVALTLVTLGTFGLQVATMSKTAERLTAREVELRGAERRLARIDDEIDLREQQLVQINSEITTANNRRAEAKAAAASEEDLALRAEELRVAVETRSTELERLQREIAVKNGEAAQLLSQVDDLTKDRDAAQRRLSSIRDQVAGLEDRRNEAAGLKRAISERRETERGITEEINRLTKRREELHRAVGKLETDRQEVARLANERENLEAKILELEEKQRLLADVPDNLADANSELADIRSQQDDANAYLSKLNTQVSTLLGQVAVLKQAREVEEGQAAQIKGRIRALESEMSGFKSVRDALSVEADLAQSKVLERQGELAKLEETLETARGTLKELKRRIAEAESLGAEIEIMEAAEVRMANSLEDLRAQVAAEQAQLSDIAQIRAEAARLRDTEVSLLGQISDLNQRADWARTAADQFEQNRQATARELVELQAELVAERIELERVRRLIATADADAIRAASLESRIRGLRQELEDLEQRAVDAAERLLREQNPLSDGGGGGAPPNVEGGQ